MKCKPPFILYNNIQNSYNSKASKSQKYDNKLNLILSRIPENIIREKPEIEKIVYPEPKVTFDIITNNKKPKMIKIANNMGEELKKKIENLNTFKEMLHNYNINESEQLGSFSDVKDENNKFSNIYKKIQKDKNKFNTGTYLDHEYLIGIASNYAKRGIKVPKISLENNVFSANPLILEGSELEDYIVYNLGDRQKSDKFLKKLEILVRKKETGNFIMSDDERKKLSIAEKNEKHKGYIDPNILIPKLKEDIKKSKITYDNIENFEKFFEIKKKPINIPKITNSRSCNSIFNDEPQTIDINSNKMRIKKNLSFISKLNNDNNSTNIAANNNSISSNVNNKYSSLSTRAFLSPKGSSENSQRNISSGKYKNSPSNISSAISREKPKYLKFSPLPSPIYRNNINHLNISLLNNIYNGRKRSSNECTKVKISNIFNKNKKIFSLNKLKKRNIISLRNNSVDPFKIGKHPLLSKDSDKCINAMKYNSNISNEDENELILLNKELDGVGDSDVGEEQNEINKNININISDNNFELINNNKTTNKNENIKMNKVKIDITNDFSAKTLDKKGENSLNAEKIFKSILSSGYKSRRVKRDITDYLKSKGYDTSKNLDIKDSYININKMKRKIIERNLILEEYKIRSREFKHLFSPKQRIILDKNELLFKKIKDNEYKFKKLMIEKNIDKPDVNYKE